MENTRFQKAREEIAKIITNSLSPEDPAHSLNTHQWLLVLKPDADEILQLAALAHDIERGLPNRLHAADFSTYEEYKAKHAERAGRKAAEISVACGYSQEDGERLAYIIAVAEERSDSEEGNLILDADSISYFDTNVELYLERKGPERTQKKISFMYERASERAKAYIEELASKKQAVRSLMQ